MNVVELQKNLAATAIFILLVAGGVYFLSLRPIMEANDKIREDITNVQNKLRGESRKWELNPRFLSELKRQYDRHRQGTRKLLFAVLKKADGEFKNLVDPNDIGLKFASWKAGVTLFEYQEMFLKIKDELARQNIYLNEEVLGLEEGSSAPRGYTYRLLARLHVVEQLARLCRKHGLQLGNPNWQSAKPDAPPIDRKRPPAMLTVLPVRAYVTDARTKSYVEEFPVQLIVRGKLGNLCQLLQNLTDEGHFLPLDRLEIRRIGIDKYQKPAYRFRTKDGGEIEARLICSGFLALGALDKLEGEPEKEEGAFPKMPRAPGA